MARITIAALQARIAELESEVRAVTAEADMFARNALNFERLLNDSEAQRQSMLDVSVECMHLRSENNALVQELDTLRKGDTRRDSTDFRARCIAAREEAKRTGFAVRV